MKTDHNDLNICIFQKGLENKYNKLRQAECKYNCTSLTPGHNTVQIILVGKVEH